MKLDFSQSDFLEDIDFRGAAFCRPVGCILSWGVRFRDRVDQSSVSAKLFLEQVGHFLETIFNTDIAKKPKKA